MSAVEPRVNVDKKLVQFRVVGEADWHVGQARNLSRSGLLFSCNACPGVGCLVEIRILDIDGKQSVELTGARCLGRVVRRVLMSWPEVVPLVAIRFVEDEGIAPACTK